MTDEKILIPSKGGIALEGLLRRPKGNGRFPTVVLVPGFGMTMHEWNNSFDEIASFLNKAGFLTLQFQFDIFKLDGAVRELPLDARAEQFEDALHWLLGRPDVDTKRIGILAQSYGVPTVLHPARLHPAMQGATLIKSLITHELPETHYY